MGLSGQSSSAATCSLPLARASAPGRSRKGCPVDNGSAAEPGKASCSWCPEPWSMLRMFLCAGARRVWGSHYLVRVRERRGVFFCAEYFFEKMSWAHIAARWAHAKIGTLTLFFRLRERAAWATGFYGGSEMT